MHISIDTLSIYFESSLLEVIVRWRVLYHGKMLKLLRPNNVFRIVELFFQKKGFLQDKDLFISCWSINEYFFFEHECKGKESTICISCLIGICCLFSRLFPTSRIGSTFLLWSWETASFICLKIFFIGIPIFHYVGSHKVCSRIGI